MRLLFLLICFVSTARAQQPFPFLVKPLAPPITNLYNLDQIGLIGIANNMELQLWDATTRAYFGVITVAAPDVTNTRIHHVEYLSVEKKIAVVVESYSTLAFSNDTTFTYFLRLYDRINLTPDIVPVRPENGICALLKKKYPGKASLSWTPAFAAYRYHYNERTGKLFLIDRNGTLEIVSASGEKKRYHTGVHQSPVLIPSSDERSVFLTDGITGEFQEIELASQKKVYSSSLVFIPNAMAGVRYPGADKVLSINPIPADNSICILDSVNRMRFFDTKRRTMSVNYAEGWNNIVGLSLIQSSKDSSLYMLCEQTTAPYSRAAMYINQKTGINAGFTQGGFLQITGFSFSRKENAFRMTISGVQDIEVDLSRLTEKTISELVVTNRKVKGFLYGGSWENGSYQVVIDSSNRSLLAVFQADSIQSRLLYTQDLSFPPSEQLVGFFPPRKWLLTTGNRDINTKRERLRIYDSTGKRIFETETGSMLHTIASTSTRKQYLFSAGNKYIFLKDVIGFGPLDSCRIRIYTVDALEQVGDIRFTEPSDFNALNHRTLFLPTDSSVFYMVRSEQPSKSTFNNYLVKYQVDGKRITKVSETLLCVGNECHSPVVIRQLIVGNDGKVCFWNGFMAGDSLQNREAVQLALYSNAETGETLGGMNFSPMPEVMKVLPFKDYLGLQYPDRIEFVRLDRQPLAPFVSVYPYANTKTGDVSLLYASYDYNKQRLFYYEKTNNDDCVSFRIDTAGYRRKQFDVAFNRPDLILSQVPGYDTLFLTLYKKAVIKRAERVENFAENFKPELMPRIAHVKTRAGTGNEVIIELKAINNIPVEQLLITINGNRFKKKKVTNVPGEPGMYSITEELVSGENRIEITPVAAGGRQGLPLQILHSQNKAFVKPVLYALVTSVGTYSKGPAPLPFAVKDGRDIAEMLRNLGKDTLFEKIIIDTLFDSNVNEATINAWMKKRKDISVVDYVIVFFSGHGFLDRDMELRLATSLTEVDDPAKSSISYVKLVNSMDDLPARQKLVLIDACHSGDFDKNTVYKKSVTSTGDGSKGLGTESMESQDNSFEVMQDFFTFSEEGNGTIVLSAAGGMQSAFENARYRNGYFTYALLEAVAGKKAERMGALWLNDIIKFVKQRVPEISNGSQQPNLRLNNPELNWRLR